jgi:hypothetical protein
LLKVILKLQSLFKESSLKGFSSLILSRGKTREEIEGNPIIIDELLVLKNTMVKAKTPTETKAMGNHIFLPRGQTNLTPPKMTADVMACFKIIRISTPVKTNVLASIIKAHIEAFPLPQLLCL